MSLNGLDEAQVKEAYDAATGEPGGWFLLKYTSRDEVDLLGRGNGGIVDMRNNISQYDETSPLYGFLKYRRRDVLVKYLPEDCSRLVQARSTVHFNAFCEKFTPYHTEFTIATAKELKDTTLSAACSLHAASGSTSSSTSSLRRRMLMEIAEEEEDEQRTAKKRSSTVLEDGNDDTACEDSHAADPRGAPEAPKSPTSPPVTLNADLASSPEANHFSASSDPPEFVGARPTSPAQSMDAGRRMSSQTARPDLYSYSSYTYGKPKVKLAARPSLETTGRPQTAVGNFRPVSQMPAGFKMYSKGSKRVKGDDDRDLAQASPHEEAEVAFATPSISVPSASRDQSNDGLPRPHTSSGRPATSSGAPMKSPTLSTFSASSKNTITPEKARLMKAMQLREKKKKEKEQATADAAARDKEEETSGGGEQLATEAKADDAVKALPPLTEEEEKRMSMCKLESDIAVDASTESLRTDPSDSARSDSRPASPLVPSSEPDQSTKASSLSESTDETVKEAAAGEEASEAKADTLERNDGETADPVATPEAENVDTNQAVETPESEEGQDQLATTGEERTDQELKELARTKVDPDASEENAEQASPEDDIEATQNLAEPFVASAQDTIEVEIAQAPSSPQISSGIAIPTSKFSANAAGPASSGVPIIHSPSGAVDSHEASLTTAPVEQPDTDTSHVTSKRSKPKNVEPIRTDLSIPDKQSDAHLSDDESLMEELQCATVQEAQQMVVSKSPASPIFPPTANQRPVDAGEPNQGAPRVVRTISNPVRGNFLDPADASQSSARSISSGAAYLHKITQQQTAGRDNLAPKTGKIGSNISQRIKALEKLSANAPGEGGLPTRSSSTRSNVPSSAFFSVRKPSREPSRSPSVAERATSLSRGSPQRGAAVSDSREGSPENRVPRERSGSVASRLSMFEMPPVPGADTMPRGRPESISVTARIVHDPSQSASFDVSGDSSEHNRLDLRQSPLEVSHMKAEGAGIMTAETPRETIQERRMSKERPSPDLQDRTEDSDGKGRRRSLSIVRDFIKDRRKSLSSPSADNLAAPSLMSPNRSPSRPPSTQNNSTSLSRRLSISSRRSSISRDAAMSPSAGTEASGSGDESAKSEKKQSRAGRFMRRLSSSISSGRGKTLTPTGISPTVQEEEFQETADPRGVSRGNSYQRQQLSQQQQQQVTVHYMGDVNVQFPDNLLWKRRTLGLDTQGFLVLSLSANAPPPSRGDSKAGGGAAPGVKRYHLGDFRPPYAPDVEVQELPNSVVLDFVEGSGLQIACEDRAGQLEVLHTLQDAHRTHSA